MSTLILLSEEEEKVFDAIQHYIEHNRVFNYEKIVPYISNTFSRTDININEKGIKSILESLIQKKIIIPGSKLTKKIVLHNPNRKLIYDFIKRNPGYYFHRLIKTLKLPNHVITWHLDVLLKFGYIIKAFIDHHEVYFHPNVDQSDYHALYALSKTKTQKILSFMYRNRKPVTKTAIAKKLGIHYNTVLKYIKMLEELDLVREEKLAHKTIYHLSQRFFDFLIK
ncbi:MAG: winged helix-turn-helix transcriptional regulator [Promethearchaeota archaeon]